MKIIGRFYFKLDDKQNLKGFFSNNQHIINYEETANRVIGNGFQGEFESEWTDNLGKFNAKLTIKAKKGSSEIYSLHWKNNVIEFFGEGIIVEDILIGDYRNFENI
ncbi:MAG: hypothetical protein ACTHMD_01390 [Flavisolibacter sp.]